MNRVDFTEIQDPLDWEFFAEAFFRAKGKNIIQGPSTGGDGGTGKDLIIEETLPSEFGDIKRKILVSCKHFAKSGKSVNADNEKDNILINVVAENCSGFLGFYSTAVSSPLQSKIQDLRKNDRIRIDIADYYDSQSIEQFLLFKDEGNLLLKNFFPESYKKWKKLGSKDAEQNPNFNKLSEEDFKVKSKDYFKKFFEGQPADWNIIRKYTFKRDSFDYVIQQLEANKVSLITGAGGEGKTTLLMQVGEYCFQKGFTVLYSFSSIVNLELSELKFKPHKKYLVILDNANAIVNLSQFVKNVKLSSNVFALLASRKNEWDYSLSTRDDKEDLSRWIGQITNLHRLTENEVAALSELLRKYHVLNEEIKEKISAFIKDSTSSNFLLAVMIYATQGKSFDFIIKDVIDKVRGWANSEKTIEAIGYIVCIEVLGKGAFGQAYCQETLLKKLLDIINIEQYRTVKKHLAQEAFFQGSLTNIIHTRNPIIANIYFECLFQGEAPLLDKYEFYYNIIRETSYSNRSYDKDILALIPKYFLAKDEQLSIQLLKDAISYGFFWNTYYSFINKEVSQGNIGIYNSDEYSARWLFEKAFEKNSKDTMLYPMWGRFELGQGDIGRIEAKYTARWIFRTGIMLQPSSQLCVIWANEEVKVDNLGKDVDDEYTARWICREGTEKVPTPDLYGTWANIEANAGNIGELISGGFEKYSARWICKEGIDKAPASELFSTWANIEISVRNVGIDIEDKYSVRWILKEGFNKTKNRRVLFKWIRVELGENNLGSKDNLYSAEWLYEMFKNLFASIQGIGSASELKEFLDKRGSVKLNQDY